MAEDLGAEDLGLRIWAEDLVGCNSPDLSHLILSPSKDEVAALPLRTAARKKQTPAPRDRRAQLVPLDRRARWDRQVLRAQPAIQAQPARRARRGRPVRRDPSVRRVLRGPRERPPNRSPRLRHDSPRSNRQSPLKKFRVDGAAPPEWRARTSTTLHSRPIAR